MQIKVTIEICLYSHQTGKTKKKLDDYCLLIWEVEDSIFTYCCMNAKC